MNARKLSVLLAAGLPLVYAACGGSDLTLPSEGEPASITIVSGDNQKGRVGSTLAQPLVVQVTDTKDRPVPGATVEFTVDDAEAGGAASPSTATTDADGRATSRIMLGTVVGPVAGTARVPVDEGTLPVVTAFSATALPASANGITAVSGDGQTGQVGTTLTNPLVVKVTDGFGNPIAGVTVVWSVTGGGSVSESSTQSDANGQASVIRTLGNAAGQQTALASAEGLVGSPVTFTHTATAGAASRVVKVSGDGQSGLAGSELPEALVVQVFDDANNPIVGRPVTWAIGSGGGSVTPQTSNTDGQGLATTRWTLGAAGNNTVSAVVSGVGTATFSATATAGSPSASRSRVSVMPGSIVVGGTSTITVRVRDAGGNPVAGVSVSASSSGTGNEINPATDTSGDDGVATFSFRSTVAEHKTITVIAGGVTLDDQRVITVFPASSTTEITKHDPNPSTSGQTVHVEFTVTGGNGGTPTGQVTIFSLQEAGGCTVPVSQGFCDITLTVVGTHRLGATYSGDLQFEESSDAVDHVVISAPPTNQAPVAQNDVYSTPGGGLPLTVSVESGVLSNDSDPDGDTLTASNPSTPSQGVVTLDSNGSFTYTPGPGATDSDSFTYDASDGELTSTATVTINITP